jgi:putative transposase
LAVGGSVEYGCTLLRRRLDLAATLPHNPSAGWIGAVVDFVSFGSAGCRRFLSRERKLGKESELSRPSLRWGLIDAFLEKAWQKLPIGSTPKGSSFLYCFSVKKLPAEPVCYRIASASSLQKASSMLFYIWFANRIKQQGAYIMKDNLSHTSWKCKYHIVFAPKYRRKNIYGVLKTDIGKILRQLCELKKVEIHEAEACPDHIHMLVSIPPNLSVSQFMGYLKGKSSLMIFDRHANLKYKYGNRHFLVSGLLR